MDFRQQVCKKYGKQLASYTITKIVDNSFRRFFPTGGEIAAFTTMDTGHLLLYEVNPSIAGAFPDSIDKCDSNNGVASEYTRLVVN